jgi:hypothetical protein
LLDRKTVLERILRQMMADARDLHAFLNQGPQIDAGAVELLGLTGTSRTSTCSIVFIRRSESASMMS